MGIIISILVLGFIIFVHEFGHFIFAKLFNVPVREFSVGMGKRVFSFIKNNTRYSLKLFPFGGSCAMIGEDIAGSGDFSDLGGIVDEEKGIIDFDGVVYTLNEIKLNNFSVINPIKKFIICLAGPFFNFILAFICAFIVLVFAGTNLPVINTVTENSAAANAKPYALQSGDIIKEMIIANSREKIDFDKDVIIFMGLHNDDFVNNNNLVLTIERNEEILNTMLTFDLEANLNKAVMGITLGANYRPKNIIDLGYYAIKEGLFYLKLTVKSLKYLISGRASVNEVSGPVGTVAIMGNAISNAGNNLINVFITILSLINLISANLGIMNLLPIPALDGGRMIEATIEMIIGHSLNEKIINAINAFTLVLLLLFMIYIMGLDIYKLFIGVFN